MIQIKSNETVNLSKKSDLNRSKRIFMQIQRAFLKDDTELAENLMSQLLESSPHNPIYSVKLGHLMYKKGLYSKAENYYQMALSIEESQKFLPEILFGLGQTYFQMKKYNESLASYIKLIDLDPNYVFVDIAYLKLSWILIDFQSYDSSMGYLVKILQNKAKNPELLVHVLCTIGRIYEIQNNHKAQRKFLLKAYKLKPNFKSVSCLVHFYLQKKPIKAEFLCQQFLSKNSPKPEWCDIRFLQSLALMKQEKIVNATKLLENISKEYPNNSIYLQNLGIAYLIQEKYTKAIDIFEGVLKIEGKKETNLNNLCIAYEKIGLKEESMIYLNKNFEESQDNTEKIRKVEIRAPDYNILEFPMNCSNI